MATLGNNTTPTSGYYFDDTGLKQFWTRDQVTMPTGGGTATDMYVYCAGDGASTTGQLVIWDSSANIVWQSGNLTLPSGSRAIGGQSWVHASIPSVYLAAGNYELGFWSSGHVVWTFQSFGGVNQKSGIGAPSRNDTNTDEYGGAGYGTLGAYVTYTPLPAPTITSASPNVAPVGSTTTVTGTNLLHTSGVTVCGVAASYTVNSDTQLTVTVPSGASGAGSLVVTTPAGSASTSFTAGQIYYGDAGGSGTVHSIVAVWYGDASGNGTPHKVAGVWVPNGAGVKRIW